MTDDVTAAVAESVRALRTERGWSLDALADRAEVSRGVLIRIEQRRTNPSLGTLVRIAEALGVGVTRLVETAPQPLISVSGPDGGTELWREGASSGRLLTGSDRREHLELWAWTLAPGGERRSEPHLPGTEELLRVEAGELLLEVDGTAHVVPAGGGAAFAADRPHAYRNPGEAPVRFSMVVVQPDA